MQKFFGLIMLLLGLLSGPACAALFVFGFGVHLTTSSIWMNVSMVLALAVTNLAGIVLIKTGSRQWGKTQVCLGSDFQPDSDEPEEAEIMDNLAQEPESTKMSVSPVLSRDDAA